MTTATATDRNWNGVFSGPNPNAPPEYREGPPGSPPRPRVLYRIGWYRAIPEELRALACWVVWRFELRGGRWTKVPYVATAPRKNARAGDPDTWRPFDKALNAFWDRPNQLDGIGFEFPNERIYTGVDFDKCLGPDGAMLDWAAELIAVLGPAYLEVSPSGAGLKAIVRGGMPEVVIGGKVKTGVRVGGFGDDKTGAVEMYSCGRFFTVTGDVFGIDAGGDE